jgi:hypothetical protein
MGKLAYNNGGKQKKSRYTKLLLDVHQWLWDIHQPILERTWELMG